MAKNIGPVKFTGKLGDISGRDTKDGNILQTPGGFKSERVKTEAKYLITRQLSTEFSRCSKISSVFYNHLGTYLKTIPDTHLYSYIQSRVCAIKECDTLSPKGERTAGKGLATEKGRALLKGFSFNRKRDLSNIVMQRFLLSLDKGQLSLPNFDVSRIIFPKGAKQLGLQLVLMRLDTETPTAIGATSAMFFVPAGTPATTIELQAPIPEGESILIGMLYAGFCNVVNGVVVWKKDVKNVLEVVGMEK